MFTRRAGPIYTPGIMYTGLYLSACVIPVWPVPVLYLTGLI